MTCGVKANLRYCARTVTAIVALAAVGYLAISSTTAETAPVEDRDDTREENESIETSNDAPADQQSEEKQRNETIIPKQYLGVGVSNTDKSDAPEASTKKPRKKSQSTKGAFRPDPQYDKKYNAAGQEDIYGGKTAVEPPRPLLEIGREQYTSGLYDESSTLFGKLNPLLPGLSIYGDWRTAVAYNKNNGKDIAQIATRLNLDVDLKITATERIHAFFTPLQNGNTKFTRFEFGGGDGDQRFTDELDFEPQTLFFEGDAGAIYSGLTGQYSSFDLPFTVGLFPLFLQNGIWANDAILGGAVTWPARNSPTIGLSNYDITFFAAFDNIDNASFIGANGKVDNDNANLFGVTTFIDAFNGYIEAGYGFLQGTGVQGDVEQHFLTAAYTRRYANTISNSTRVFANFGDDGRGSGDGVAIISENSLISPLPSTLLPYANFFIGFGNPEPLVDGNNAGILKNVGINFETDALTGYPKLDDTGSNAVGGALGVEYLFNLDQQLVFEVATVQPFEDDGIGAKGAQYGFGVRYQIPITRSWLFRADATYQIREGDEDNFGFRTELRSKF
jgi:hypothetical protein